ncbi:MAG: peptide transporter ATP-binding protein [Acidimicrobiaceae bacterium]|nr:peptide transporter ATP-binding protein [Acidimicrobiaceae bacterium]
MGTDGLANAAPSGTTLLEVRDLHTYFPTRRGVVKAVNGVSFEVEAASSLGIVGESGSGKSVMSLSIMGLIEPPGYIASGSVIFKGRDITGLRDAEMRSIRGREIGLVFQEPMSALNPVYKVGDQVIEALRAHARIGRSEARDRAIELFRLVGIPAPEQRVKEYPRSLSGGMRQRVVIAMAIANNPQLAILDEPTTALDVTTQAQILDLVRDLGERLETAVVLITHDIAVVSEMCSQVIVMYGGRIMERATSAQIVDDPKHPYTVGLISSVPSPELKGQRLRAIDGSVPNPLAMPSGCPFATRCPNVMEQCAAMPPTVTLNDRRQVACWLFQ